MAARACQPRGQCESKNPRCLRGLELRGGGPPETVNCARVSLQLGTCGLEAGNLMSQDLASLGTSGLQLHLSNLHPLMS
jgi:hypothetical protein